MQQGFRVDVDLANSPGLFSREWIETNTIGDLFKDCSILPAYLVGSGLKPVDDCRWQRRRFHSPGLFSREWIETPISLSSTDNCCNSPGLFSREWIETCGGILLT